MKTTALKARLQRLNVKALWWTTHHAGTEWATAALQDIRAEREAIYAQLLA